MDDLHAKDGSLQGCPCGWEISAGWWWISSRQQISSRCNGWFQVDNFLQWNEVGGTGFGIWDRNWDMKQYMLVTCLCMFFMPEKNLECGIWDQLDQIRPRTFYVYEILILDFGFCLQRSFVPKIKKIKAITKNLQIINWSLYLMELKYFAIFLIQKAYIRYMG